MAIKILYRGHNGERHIYYICACCGTAFYDDTFMATEGPNTALCPVCNDVVSEVAKELFESYVKSHNYLAEHISTEGCADRAPNGTDN